MLALGTAQRSETSLHLDRLAGCFRRVEKSASKLGKAKAQAHTSFPSLRTFGDDRQYRDIVHVVAVLEARYSYNVCIPVFFRKILANFKRYPGHLGAKDVRLSGGTQRIPVYECPSAMPS